MQKEVNQNNCLWYRKLLDKKWEASKIWYSRSYYTGSAHLLGNWIGSCRAMLDSLQLWDESKHVCPRLASAQLSSWTQIMQLSQPLSSMHCYLFAFQTSWNQLSPACRCLEKQSKLSILTAQLQRKALYFLQGRDAGLDGHWKSLQGKLTITFQKVMEIWCKLAIIVNATVLLKYSHFTGKMAGGFLLKSSSNAPDPTLQHHAQFQFLSFFILP